MLRKKLTPSSIRRCAVFLGLGSALAFNVGTLQGGLALDGTDVQTAAVTSHDGPGGSPAVVDGYNGQSGLALHTSTQRTSKDASAAPWQAAPSEDLTGPELTGQAWFQGLQQGVDHAFDSQAADADPASPPQKDSTILPDNGVKANAIPSLPSFWSGLTCCLALVVAGLFPRVRRVLR